MRRPRLRRDIGLAAELARGGQWSALAEKLGRRLGRGLGPAAEGYTLARDAIGHTYWRARGSLLPPLSRPLSDPVVTQYGDRNRAKNVIWIMLDALRHDMFQAYLQRGGFSELLSSGVYFPAAFSQGSWTYPSVFSFLTGRFPFNCGASRIVDEGGQLASACAEFDEHCPTVFSILRQQGFQVGSILDGWGFTVRTTAGQEQREDRYFEEHWGWVYGQERRFIDLPELRDATISYVREASRGDPFMLFVRTLYTHSPYLGIFQSPEQVTNLSRRRWAFRLQEGFIRGLRHFEAIYLKPLLQALAAMDLPRETMFVICSDHGEMLWNLEADLRAVEREQDDEIWRHQLEPYQALIKVPLLISGGQFRGVFSQRFRLVDVLPTLLAELGVPHAPHEFDGVAVGYPHPRPLYADSAGNGQGGIAFQAAGAKLLLSRRLGATAYDVGTADYERLEGRRPAGDLGELRAFLQTAIRDSDGVSEAADEAILVRRLQALGYIE